MASRKAFVGIGLASLLVPVSAAAGEGLAALQTADPSCPDDSGAIYVDCGNGTVTDNRSGLVWLANAECFGFQTWADAVAIAASLSDQSESFCQDQGRTPEQCDCGLSDGSSPGEWRLPTASEWQAMIEDAEALGCVNGELGGPAITTDAGTACWQEGPASSFTGVEAQGYWSASTNAQVPGSAWLLGLGFGNFASSTKGSSAFVWPVRGGQ